MGSAARYKAGGVSLRFERTAARASLRTGPRPITSSNPRSVGCHSPKAVHRGSLVRHKKWRAVAALRGRPTRRQCTMGSAARHKAGGLSLRSERNAARAALRTGPPAHYVEQSTIRRVSLAEGSAPGFTGAAQKMAGCRCAPRPPYPQAGAPGGSGAAQSWRAVAALRTERRPSRPANWAPAHYVEQSTIRRVSLAEGSAPGFTGAAQKLAGCRCAINGSPSGPLLQSGLRLERQQQAGAEAAFGVVGQLQSAAVALGGTAGNRQAEPMPRGALPRRTEEGFAQSAQMFGGNARSVVAYAEAQFVGLALGLELDRLACRVEAQGIAQQVVQRPFEHVRPAVQACAGFQFDLHPLLRGVELCLFLQLAQQRGKVDRLRCARIGVEAGEGENLADPGLPSVALARQAWPELFPLGGVGAFGQGQCHA